MRANRLRILATTMAVFWMAAAMVSRAHAQPAPSVHRYLTNPVAPSAQDQAQIRAALPASGTPMSSSGVRSPGRRLDAAQAPRKNDSVLNGVLIGAGVGALLGLIPDHYDDCEECHDSLYASIAVGAGIGLVIDLLKKGSQNSSAPSQSGQSFRLDVAIAPQSVGIPKSR
jgi:hypothetical protein